MDVVASDSHHVVTAIGCRSTASVGVQVGERQAEWLTRRVVDGLVLAHQCDRDAGGYAAERARVRGHVDEMP
jgi:hypothetical protein